MTLMPKPEVIVDVIDAPPDTFLIGDFPTLGRRIFARLTYNQGIGLPTIYDNVFINIIGNFQGNWIETSTLTELPTSWEILKTDMHEDY